MKISKNNFYRQEPLFFKICYLFSVVIFLLHLYELVVNPISFISSVVSRLLPITAYGLVVVMSLRQYLYIKRIKKIENIYKT